MQDIHGHYAFVQIRSQLAGNEGNKALRLALDSPQSLTLFRCDVCVQLA